MPLVPFLRAGGWRANAVEHLCALPGEVGGAEISVAASLLGTQVRRAGGQPGNGAGA